jgi:hypothetical protein
MVLIYLLIACLKNPTVTESPNLQQWPTWMVLEMETDQSVPTNVSNRLQAVAQQHNIQLQSQSIPADFEPLKITNAATSPLLIVESKADFYAQVNGRFRWEVQVNMTLYDGKTHLEQQFTVPVFHQFHHQRQKEALEAALPAIERKLHAMLNEHLQAQ